MKELERSDLMGLNGGYTPIPKWVKGGLWFALASVVMDHWTEIKAGVIDGWTDAMKENNQ